jgi:uncharacterized protein YidB (DUF937 family)
MDLFETLKGQLGGLMGGNSTESDAGAPDAATPSLVAAVLAMLKEHGLASFVQMLQSKGLGNLVSSWVGTGPNQEATGAQIAEAFDESQLNTLSEQSGVPRSQLPDMLARILPGLIDKLTPTGLVEEGSMVDQALDFVKARLAAPAKP